MAALTNPPLPARASGSKDQSQRPDQLKRDRVIAILVLIVVALLMALMIWLASLGNGGAEGIDYWPMMP